MPRINEITVIIPMFNERDTILDVLKETFQYIDTEKDITWEVIVVDDASKDSSSDIVKSSGFEVTLIQHPSNRGYGYSIKSGIRAAKFKHLLLIDADGQHVVAETRKLIDLAGELDMVIGCRLASKSSVTRNIGKSFLKLMIGLFISEEIHDFNSGHRLIKKSTIANYTKVCSDRFSFSMSSTVALLSQGHFVGYIEVDSRERQGNKSTLNFRSAMTAALQVIRLVVWFHPLRLFIPISIFFFLLFVISISLDLVGGNLTDASLLLMMVSFFSAMTGLISDQISRQNK